MKEKKAKVIVGEHGTAKHNANTAQEIKNTWKRICSIEARKVGRPHPKTAVVEEAKGYERTYEGFFSWVRDTERDVPMFALRDYCELEKLRTKVCSNSIREAIAHAQRDYRVEVFDDIKEFLENGYKVKVARAPSGMHSWIEKMIRRLGEGDRSRSSTLLKRHDAAVKANATRKAKQEGGAK